VTGLLATELMLLHAPTLEKSVRFSCPRALLPNRFQSRAVSTPVYLRLLDICWTSSNRLGVSY
jgi:hypothetical protein